MNYEWHDVACPCHAQLCAAAAVPGFENVVVVAVTGGSGADAAAVGAAGERTAPVAVETGIGSTQQGAACGRVGPGCRTQGARALAAPSHLMRKRRRNVTKLRTKRHKCTYTHKQPFSFWIHTHPHCANTLKYNIVLSISFIIHLPHIHFKTVKPL